MGFPIVGIGASAGGIEALGQFFHCVPASPEMAFVVVTHLGRGHDSLLPEILGRASAVPVIHATDGITVEVNHVYVLPHQAVMTFADGKLQLRSTVERNPIDIFLCSLAEDMDERAVGIILSGGGNDGTLGVKAVKEHGGLTLAQGDHPKYESMPYSAIATGLVDIIATAEAMPKLLKQYFEIGDKIPATEGSNPGKADICKILHTKLGHDFSGYKENTFMRRVKRRMQVLQLTEIPAYIEALDTDELEPNLLFRDLLISVTGFFRDPPAFATLEETVIPKLFEGKGRGDHLRVWVPGCATGEEVYSLAMLLLEYAATLPDAPTIQVFGTDIDDDALNTARAGRYPPNLLRGISKERLAVFCKVDGVSSVVTKALREVCIFSVHSVFRDPPFSKIDLVSCRNLLIYLNAPLQAQVIPIFHYALRSGGYLMVGLSEHIPQNSNLFAAVDRKHRLFKRRDNALTKLPAISMDRSVERMHRTLTPIVSPNIRHWVEAKLLDRFTPAYVVINRECDILYFSGGTGKYLEAPVGTPSRQLMESARVGLRVTLKEAVRIAFDTNSAVTRDRVAVETEDRVQFVKIVVEPLTETDNTLFIVIFVDAGSFTHASTAPGMQPDVVEENQKLQEQLQAVREENESSVEELKAANEELAASTEELQSANEELASSKEEMQSLNEEMMTVNHELNIKVQDLDQANSDLKNLFESTGLAVVFLDRNFVIRDFTPAASQYFSLIPTDRGRPLTDLYNNLGNFDYLEDAKAVFESGEPTERRIDSDDDKHYLMRVLPYRGTHDEIDGVLLTLIDIHSLVDSEKQKETLVSELNHRVRNMLGVIIAIVQQTQASNPDPTKFVETMLGRLHSMARAYDPISNRSWAAVPLREIIASQLEPYTPDSNQVSIEGPPILVKPRVALSLGMICHELATNALKYGALSDVNGQTKVSWAMEHRHHERWLSIKWRESHGPAVKQPDRKGFGSELITRTIHHELGGEASLDYAPDGLKVTVSIPYPPVGDHHEADSSG